MLQLLLRSSQTPALKPVGAGRQAGARCIAGRQQAASGKWSGEECDFVAALACYRSLDNMMKLVFLLPILTVGIDINQDHHQQ